MLVATSFAAPAMAYSVAVLEAGRCASYSKKLGLFIFPLTGHHERSVSSPLPILVYVNHITLNYLSPLASIGC